MTERSSGSVPWTFVDAVEASTSLRIQGMAVYERLRQHIDVDLVVSPRDPSRGVLGRPDPQRSLKPNRPVVLSYLANFLGRAGHLVPDLRSDRLRVLFVGWELEQLTRQLLAELRTADVVLGMSPYIAGVYRSHLPDTPVVTAHVVPELPENVFPDRHRFGLPADEVLFLYIFDPVSAFDRKNPVDLYRAFQLAFPGRTDVRLVFKVHGDLTGAANATGADGELTRSAEFLRLVASDERVTLIHEFMSYREVMSLVASCDVFVSLSRAEGIGLPVLEAMTLGVPTVCTAYSGHLDFTTDDSALLVPVRLVDIPSGASYHYQPEKYEKPPRWAEPDLNVAAAHLRLLADHPDERREWGAKAAAQARRYRRECAGSGWVEELTAAVESPGVAAGHPRRHAAYRALTDPAVAEWDAHERRVYWARARLRVRTRLGKLKRAAVGALRRVRGRYAREQ